MKKGRSPLATSKSVTRRRFLQSTATALIAVPWINTTTALGAEGRPAASDRLVMGAIGVGGRGSGNMRNFLGFGEVQMVAVCDVRSSSRQGAKNSVDKKYGDKGCKEYNDFRDLLERRDIDAVCIGTPDHWHAIPAIQACRQGKDVYCEKPLTLTIQEGRAMVDAARRYGRVVSGGSQRVLGDYGRLARSVWSGEIGEVKEAFVNVGGPSRPCYLGSEPIPKGFDWDLWLGPAPWAPHHSFRCGRAYGLGGKGFRSWRDYSGGMMTDWGGHCFGGAMYALNLLESGPVEVIPPDGKDHELLTYRFDNGILMYHAPGKIRGNLLYKGTKGRLPKGKDDPPNRGEIKEDVDIPVYKGKGGIYGDFLHCVRTRERPFRDVERSHRTATICHLGNIAYELKRPLKWDPEKEVFPEDEQANRLLDRARREPWTL